jgi:hypothetical protein
MSREEFSSPVQNLRADSAGEGTGGTTAPAYNLARCICATIN